jgi:hypothetical protein
MTPGTGGETKQITKSGQLRKQRDPRPKLMKWTDNDWKQAVLAIVHACGQDGIPIPFDKAARVVNENVTGGAFQQALLKLRQKLIAEGHDIPPLKMSWTKKDNSSLPVPLSDKTTNGKVDSKTDTKAETEAVTKGDIKREAKVEAGDEKIKVVYRTAPRKPTKDQEAQVGIYKFHVDYKARNELLALTAPGNTEQIVAFTRDDANEERDNDASRNRRRGNMGNGNLDRFNNPFTEHNVPSAPPVTPVNDRRMSYPFDVHPPTISPLAPTTWNDANYAMPHDDDLWAASGPLVNLGGPSMGTGASDAQFDIANGNIPNSDQMGFDLFGSLPNPATPVAPAASFDAYQYTSGGQPARAEEALRLQLAMPARLSPSARLRGRQNPAARRQHRTRTRLAALAAPPASPLEVPSPLPAHGSPERPITLFIQSGDWINNVPLPPRAETPEFMRRGLAAAAVPGPLRSPLQTPERAEEQDENVPVRPVGRNAATDVLERRRGRLGRRALGVLEDRPDMPPVREGILAPAGWEEEAEAVEDLDARFQ